MPGGADDRGNVRVQRGALLGQPDSTRGQLRIVGEARDPHEPGRVGDVGRKRRENLLVRCHRGAGPHYVVVCLRDVATCHGDLGENPAGMATLFRVGVPEDLAGQVFALSDRAPVPQTQRRAGQSAER